ncbi:Mitochondrial presequence protease [Basidiobolus ranarum]|uniref:Presequence protease, mitochondrial n=1 Tax=Basidiobolus ranarum TaxID=34480 RepID=A0ABR2WRP2_9FUNG
MLSHLRHCGRTRPANLLNRGNTTSLSTRAAFPTTSYLSRKRYSTVLEDKSTFAPGAVVNGFKVEEVRDVKEFNLTAIRLRHEKTGAEYLHLARDDSNNVFSVGFSTAPSDNTGITHILEHTTLCGSEKFPVRDPFFKMLNRSMSTFMNAWTASDYTQYPFATQNPADYANLRDVYMDAVFAPKLRKLDFLQEGWRIENEDLNNASSPLTFKGVVYNEMKGSLSDSGTLFYHRAQQSMFPGTTYGYVSGGDPQYITDLTHEELVHFHQNHYHPTNAKFFSYGNFPLKSQLESVNNKISQFSPIEIQDPNKIVTPFTSPKKVVVNGPYDTLGNPEKQTKMSVSYLTNDATNVFESFSMNILSGLLLDGPASPMYKALIDSNLGSEYSSNTGYNTSTRTSSFSVGLQGIKSTDVDTVGDTIQRVLEQAHKDGFSKRRIDTIVHPIELGNKHKTANFGLTIMQAVSSSWFHGNNPIDLLEIDQSLKRIKEEAPQKGFFESRIEKYFLNNPHKLTFVMEPEAKYNEQLIENEVKRLTKITSTLTDSDKKHIFQRGLDLRASQETVEDISCLPSLALSDIPLKGERTALDHSAIDEVPVQWRSTSTNGISYLRAISTLRDMPEELKIYLPLFCDSLTFLGTKDKSMAEIDEEIRLYTGGVSFSHFLSSNHSDIDQFEEGISFSSHALDQNIPQMYDMVLNLINETNFENVDRLKTLILSNSSSLLNSIPDSGHVFARVFASSTLSPTMKMSEISSGLTQVELASKLANNLDNINDVVEKLKAIQSFVFNKASLRVAVNGTEEALGHNQKHLKNFLQGLGSSSTSGLESTSTFSPEYRKSFIPLPFSTNFAAKCLKTVPYTHEDSAKLTILGNLMTHRYLHREIREKNGAYGGGAGYAANTGIFSFFS